MSDTFTCATCGGTFGKVRSDEESLAESKELWGNLSPDHMMVICDDCFTGGADQALAEHAALGYPRTPEEYLRRKNSK